MTGIFSGSGATLGPCSEGFVWRVDVAELQQSSLLSVGENGLLAAPLLLVVPRNTTLQVCGVLYDNECPFGCWKASIICVP